MCNQMWVNVDDSLPGADGPYLIYCKSLDPEKPLMTKAWYGPDFGWSGIYKAWIDAITHWMELPEPPE